MNLFFNALRADLRNALRAKFFLAVAIIPFLLIIDNWDSVSFILSGDDQNEYSLYYLYCNAVSFGGVYCSYLLAMVCALPYAASFCVEMQNDVSCQAMVRSSPRVYLVSKYVACLVTGGLVNGLGHLAFILLLSFRFPLFLPSDLLGMEGFYYIEIAMNNGAAFFSIAVYFATLNGALLAAVAMWSSGFVRNAYAVFVAPAVAIFVEIQFSRMLGLSDQWRPHMWMVMRSMVHSEQVTILLLFPVIVGILLLGMWHFCRMGRAVLLNG